LAKDKEFRDSVLAGAGRTERDSVPTRTKAVHGYYIRTAGAAASAQASAEAALAKAQDQVRAAEAAVRRAQAARKIADANVAAARRLLDDVEAGVDLTAHIGEPLSGDVQVQAGVARARGGVS
jgi:hypothetical protein